LPVLVAREVQRLHRKQQRLDAQDHRMHQSHGVSTTCSNSHPDVLGSSDARGYHIPEGCLKDRSNVPFGPWAKA
jgi:hypothetical protein